MPSLTILCSHCGHQTALDAAKVPDHPVAYKCPKCKGKIVVDKQKLLGGVESPSESTSGVPDAGATGAKTDAEELQLPPGETMPPGFLIAEDEAIGEQLAAQLEAHESKLLRLDVETAREKALIEPPPFIAFVASTIGKPPYEPLAPIVRLPPRERRQVFLVLCAADAKTLDGNLAFLFEANLLLAHRHIPKAAGIIYAALRHHRRLYRPFLEAANVRS